jgi:mRNA-binding protein PUF3
MKPQLVNLKKYNYGKQIAAIEKLIFIGPQPYTNPSPISAPIEINSAAPTPSLTNGQNSPQSSSLPSTNVSTIDDPTESGKTNGDGNSCPEVVINGI